MKPRYIAFFVALLVTGCANRPALLLPSIKPYSMDIQQGNVVTQEMLNKVKPGMSRSQVRFALGTPLIVDPFHTDRWDYVYLFQKAGVVLQQRRIVAVFKDDQLIRIEGDVVPAGAPGTPGVPKGAPAEKPEPATSKPAEVPAAATSLPGAASAPAEASARP